MNDQAWMDAAVACWWGSLRIPPAKRWMVHEVEMGGYAKRLVGREDRDRLAHHVNTLGIYAQSEMPGDPLPGFRKAVKAYLACLPEPRQALPGGSGCVETHQSAPPVGQGCRSCSSGALIEDFEMAKSKVKADAIASGVERYPCEYGSVALGKQTFGLAVRFARKKLKLKDADRLLCGARLKVRVVKDANVDVDGPGQLTLEAPDPADVLESVVDVKSYGVRPDGFTAKLQFPSEDTEVDDLVEFRFEKGYIELERVGDCEKRKGKDGGDGSDADQGEFEGGE